MAGERWQSSADASAPALGEERRVWLKRVVDHGNLPPDRVLQSSGKQRTTSQARNCRAADLLVARGKWPRRAHSSGRCERPTEPAASRSPRTPPRSPLQGSITTPRRHPEPRRFVVRPNGCSPGARSRTGSGLRRDRTAHGAAVMRNAARRGAGASPDQGRRPETGTFLRSEPPVWTGRTLVAIRRSAVVRSRRSSSVSACSSGVRDSSQDLGTTPSKARSPTRCPT
jgi:hypothetical protein